MQKGIILCMEPRGKDGSRDPYEYASVSRTDLHHPRMTSKPCKKVVVNENGKKGLNPNQLRPTNLPLRSPGQTGSGCLSSAGCWQVFELASIRSRSPLRGSPGLPPGSLFSLWKSSENQHEPQSIVALDICQQRLLCPLKEFLREIPRKFDEGRECSTRGLRSLQGGF
jgi:hypothetical protein